MEIYTNRKDFVRLLTLEIIEKVMQADEKDFSEIGRAEIKTTSTHLFHSPLPFEEWLKAINKFVATASKSTVQSETKTK